MRNSLAPTGHVAALCGIAGPVALFGYFLAPAVLNWPYAGASASAVVAYAVSHQTLFFAGAWLQITGTLLCVVFFTALIALARAAGSVGGLVALAASACLLAVVVVEGALLVAVPMAASAGDATTALTTFDLSNGVFVRAFPLAPASATSVALGAVILSSRLLHRGFGYSAIALGIAFEVAGTAAVFIPAALIAIAVLAAGQGIWVVAAAIGLWRRA